MVANPTSLEPQTKPPAMVDGEASPAEAGFAAGTLVHTIRGLVPIEEIKLGDLVLSKPKGGGDVGYQPVTKVLVQDFKEVMLLDICFPKSREYIVAAYDPPCTRFERLTHGNEVEILNGATVEVGQVGSLYFSGKPGFAVVVCNDRQWSEGGWMVDLAAQPVAVSAVNDFNCVRETSPRVLVTVYDLEVQGRRAYYVGKAGLWVHSDAQASAAVPNSERVCKLIARVAEQGEPISDIRLDRIDVRQCVAQLSADEAAYVEIAVPNRLEMEHLDALSRTPQTVLQHGRVVWGHTVRANDELFDEGECGNLGAVVYDPTGQLSPAALRPVALRLAQHFGGEMIPAALRRDMFRLDEQFCGEWKCPIAMPVPQPHGPNDLVVSALYFDRQHLPNGMLVLDYYPLLISDAHPGAVMLLPSRWWPQSYRDIWDAPKRARFRSEWEDYWMHLAHDRCDQDEQQLCDCLESIQRYVTHGIDDDHIALLTKLGSPGFKPGNEPAPLEWEWELDAHLDSLAEIYVTDVERVRARGGPLLVERARQAFAIRYTSQMLGLHRLMLQPQRGYEALHGAFYADEIQYVALGLVAGCELQALRMARMLCAAWQYPHVYNLVRPEVRAIFILLAHFLNVSIPVLNTIKDAPRLDALLDGNRWLHADAATLAPLLEAACTEHTEGAPEGPFRGLPMALVLMLKFRAQQGKINPTVAHPMLASALGDWPAQVGLDAILESTMHRVRKRLTAHAYDEDAIEAAVLHGKPLAVPVHLGRPARPGDSLFSVTQPRYLAQDSTSADAGSMKVALIGMLACFFLTVACGALMLVASDRNTVSRLLPSFAALVFALLTLRYVAALFGIVRQRLQATLTTRSKHSDRAGIR